MTETDDRITEQERLEMRSALAHYLTTTTPSENQSFDEYMHETIAHFSELTDDEINSAVRQAAAKCRRDAHQLLDTAEKLAVRQAADGRA